MAGAARERPTAGAGAGASSIGKNATSYSPQEFELPALPGETGVATKEARHVVVKETQESEGEEGEEAEVGERKLERQGTSPARNREVTCAGESNEPMDRATCTAA